MGMGGSRAALGGGSRARQPVVDEAAARTRTEGREQAPRGVNVAAAGGSHRPVSRDPRSQYTAPARPGQRGDTVWERARWSLQ